VFQVNGTPLSWQGRMLARCLAAGPGALVSHRSAAALWDLEGFGPPGLVDITVAHGRCPSPSGVRLHRSRDLELAGGTKRYGVPVTGVARTLLDVAGVVPEEFDALRALDDSRRRGLVTWPELWETLAVHAGRGRRGVVRFRRILEQRHGVAVPQTRFAALVQCLLIDSGLPEPIAEFRVGPYRLDLAYPERLVGIECDGKVGHLNERAFETDPVRENYLKLEGWLILRYTWRRFTRQPQTIVTEVRQALGR
jgi:hypothetical protein